MDKIKIRESFPHINENQIYFNHASIGPMSIPVRKRINEYLDCKSTNIKRSLEMFLSAERSAKEKVGRMLNCRPDQLAWKDNVANSLSVLANGINWQKGDRIILNDIEFPSNVYPFMNLKTKGVEVDFVKSKKGVIEIDDIVSKIEPKTRMISISLVQFLSGFRIDINKLGEICKNNNIIFCVDAIQGAGVVQIDVQKANVDFLAGGAQKWLMAIMGTSYLYVSDKLFGKITPQEVGWTSVVDPWNLTDYDLTLAENVSRFQTGTMNALGVVAFNKSLDLFETVGFDKIENEVISNTNYFINSLCGIGIDPLLKSADNKNKAGIVTFKVKNPEVVLEKLRENNIIGELRVDYIRMAPHFYNTKEEIDEVIKQLNRLL